MAIFEKRGIVRQSNMLEFIFMLVCPLSARRITFSMVLRRTFVAAVTLALWQAVALAQAPKVYRVGLVGVGAPDTGILGPGMVRNFTQRGYVDGQTIVFERRAAQGKIDRLPGFIDELVAKHVDVIITQSYPAAAAAKERAGNT